MTNVLLYNKGSHVTAKALSRLLGLVRAKTITSPQEFPLVRYGNSTSPLETDTEFNNPLAISLVADSLAFSNFCIENEFRATRYLVANETNLDEVAFPVLLRKKYHHGGLDIIVVNSREQLESALRENRNHRYLVPYVHTDLELRVHYLGQPVKIFKKINGEATDGINIRSSYKGWHYERVSMETFSGAAELVGRLMPALNLKFGAVDLGWNRERREYTIFEVNSAPGLNQVTLDLYASYLRENLL